MIHLSSLVIHITSTHLLPETCNRYPRASLGAPSDCWNGLLIPHHSCTGGRSEPVPRNLKPPALNDGYDKQLDSDAVERVKRAVSRLSEHVSLGR
jgi:hypothetical protein